MHRVRHPEDQLGYISVHNSETFQRFGEQQLSNPGPWAMLESRKFFDMKLEEVKERKREVGQVRTLAGIKTKYQYICLPDGKVMWRHYPCCCPSCLDLQWESCEVPQLVGKLETVMPPGSTLYTYSKMTGGYNCLN